MLLEPVDPHRARRGLHGPPGLRQVNAERVAAEKSRSKIRAQRHRRHVKQLDPRNVAPRPLKILLYCFVGGEMPGIGSPRAARSPAALGCRSIPIPRRSKGFAALSQHPKTGRRGDRAWALTIDGPRSALRWRSEALGLRHAPHAGVIACAPAQQATRAVDIEISVGRTAQTRWRLLTRGAGGQPRCRGRRCTTGDSGSSVCCVAAATSEAVIQPAIIPRDRPVPTELRRAGESRRCSLLIAPLTSLALAVATLPQPPSWCYRGWCCPNTGRASRQRCARLPRFLPPRRDEHRQLIGP